MRGYRDDDLISLSHGMWDMIINRTEALEEGRIEYLNLAPKKAELLVALSTRVEVLEDMFKQMCDALREWGIQGMPNPNLCKTCKLKSSCSLSDPHKTRTECNQYIPQ